MSELKTDGYHAKEGSNEATVDLENSSEGTDGAGQEVTPSQPGSPRKVHGISV